MEITFRNNVRPEDILTVDGIIRSTGFFREDEIIVARELVDERLTKGPASGYEFLFAETGAVTVAFACYGLIPCSLVSYDLYWIATSQAFRNKGIGRRLLQQAEGLVGNAGGLALYIETSSKPEYEPTRVFYTNNGYLLKAELEDYYEPGDHKLIYVKKIRRFNALTLSESYRMSIRYPRNYLLSFRGFRRPGHAFSSPLLL